VNCNCGLYATYKLALALIATARLNEQPSPEQATVERLLTVQREDGGFVTDYTIRGRPVGETNVETTSLVVLALDGLGKPAGGT
jgi:hypothetical protein